MVQPGINQRKNLARSLRRGGYSYSEIRKFVNVPKATLAFWTRDLKLSDEQVARLRKKQLESVKQGTKNRSEGVARTIQQIELSAIKNVGAISKRELWLMGILLYWRNRNKNDIHKGVSFSSGDPDLVRLFLKWLEEAGRIPKEEIALDLFLGRPKDKKEAITFWVKETGFPTANFTNFYYYKKPSKPILKIRVKASSMLARQLSGWIEAIKSLI
ncbi:MAG: hypothetical protein A2941_00740 [Candidatus Yanofskybacteria bacterium RIFCSPLOWO2_01_FULL_49_17]|uniref:Uncharacterized protein n=1 Tax=Candidatus Yanofskybacteria bacterium RIFCSPLOWO2_01_FULL_49_17 TaxID=1802700 RepID=A0A1F8GS87_9BACT|nr:MAG: hypothetical protein A2941_00740 [Candidatus Yanofskybacteria bacterium RIFCSPLOWO2_01_FULL_49_17]